MLVRTDERGRARNILTILNQACLGQASTLYHLVTMMCELGEIEEVSKCYETHQSCSPIHRTLGAA